jgi:predicted DNA-binding transcriptional regulator YafY
MRKAARLFEIIQILRLAKKPMTAAQIADRLGVVSRSIYRDIEALQAMHVPIEGERGIGYVMRSGFNLPPLMFSVEETEAIVLALALLDRIGDVELMSAAKRVNQKIAAAVPPPLRQILEANALHAWGRAPQAPLGIDLATVRRAIRTEQKIKIQYSDQLGRTTDRKIWPLALVYYSEAAHIVAWCELRQALRHFRTDRIRESEFIEEFFSGSGDSLRRDWVAGWDITTGQE